MQKSSWPIRSVTISVAFAFLMLTSTALAPAAGSFVSGVRSSASALSVSVTTTTTGGTSPLTVGFGGSASGGTPPYSYLWDFGDGSANNTSQSPVHTYYDTEAGGSWAGCDANVWEGSSECYPATLEITDALGDVATSTVDIYLFSSSLSASITTTTTGGSSPLEVGFGGSASGGTPPYSYLWDFGDGSANSTAQSPAHVYFSGSYSATLLVRDAAGDTATTTSIIDVTGGAAGPAVSASASVSNGPPPLRVAFTSTEAGCSSTATFVWDFGDGQNVTAQNPSHTYELAGSFPASVIVSCSGLGISTYTLGIDVAYPLFTSSVSATPSSGSPSLSVTFAGLGDGGLGPYSYLWDFGDGSARTAIQNPTHVYSHLGVFQATLTVTDAFEVNTTTSVTVSVAWLTLTATASVSVSGGTPPLGVSFTGSGGGGLGPYRYLWDFGDGSTSSPSQNPSHQYVRPGVFSATVTVRDALGTNATALVTVAVSGTSLPYPVTMNVSPSNCSPVFLANISMTNGSMQSLNPGIYQIAAPSCAGYTFAGWSSTANISLGSVTLSATTATVSGPGSITATFVPVSTAGVAPSITAFIATPAIVTLGGWTNFSVSATGGTGALNYAFSGLPSGCKSADQRILACHPTAAGAYAVRAYVNDSASHSTTTTAALVVLAPPASSSSFPSSASTFDYAILGTVLVGVAIVVAVVLLTRHGKSLPPS